MEKILVITFALFGIGFGLGVKEAMAAPTSVIQTLPNSNETAQVVVMSSGAVSAVTVSSFTITKVDTAFNAAMSAAYGANYQRTEITVQNNDTTDKFCGFSSSALTIANSYKITVGSVWTWKLGKGMGVYCLNSAGASGTLIVGGVAWK